MQKAAAKMRKKSQNGDFILVLFAPFRGHSVGTNSPGRLDFQAGSLRQSRCGEGGANPVKVSQTDAAGQIPGQISANALS
jgi:hypothetical protein